MLLRAIRLQVIAIVSKRTLVLSDRNSAQLRLIRKGVKILRHCQSVTRSLQVPVPVPLQQWDTGSHRRDARPFMKLMTFLLYLHDFFFSTK